MGIPNQELAGDSAMPLRLGEARQFASVRDLLRDVPFSEPTLCQRLKLKRFEQVLELSRGGVTLSEASDCLGVLIRLFLLCETVSLKEVRGILPPGALDAFEALGLVARDAVDGGKVGSPVALYPVGDLFIVSDFLFSPEGGNSTPAQDFVYPAIVANTAQFLALLPSDSCERLLDLCSGTGVAALLAAPYAKRAWAIDITERSTLMAEFNRRLNGLENVTVVRGDLYEPVEGLKFDRIVAHPPYMPAPRAAEIFYDGGRDGEQITRRIVQGLPQYLLPGGRFYCLTLGSDRQEQPFERRIRGWLGDHEAEFDVGLIVGRLCGSGELAMQWAVKTRSGPEGASELKKALSDLGIETLVYGWVILQRKADDRPAFTVRRQAGTRCGREEIEWLLHWGAVASEPGALERLADARIVVNPSIEFHTVHRLKEGKLIPDDLMMHTHYPFDARYRAHPWVPHLMAKCDGKSTARELHRICIQDDLIKPETPWEEFLKLLVTLISGGFVQAEDPRFPKFRYGDSTATE
jgi:methylase of polypeptide subunit release factors